MAAAARQDWTKTAILAHPAAVAAAGLVADAERGGEERRGSTAVSHKEREKGGEVELLPNVWWQAVARKSGSLGKSSHKDQQQKARGERRNG